MIGFQLDHSQQLKAFVVFLGIPLLQVINDVRTFDILGVQINVRPLTDADVVLIREVFPEWQTGSYQDLWSIGGTDALLRCFAYGVVAVDMADWVATLKKIVAVLLHHGDLSPLIPAMSYVLFYGEFQVGSDELWDLITMPNLPEI